MIEVVFFIVGLAAGIYEGFQIGKFPGFGFKDRLIGLYSQHLELTWKRIKRKTKW